MLLADFSSFCKPYPASCGWDGFSDNSIHNHWILYGALLGGPDALDDKHVDDRTGKLNLINHHYLEV